MSTKSEFPMSIRTKPTVSVRLAASARAARLRTKPSSAIAAATGRRVGAGLFRHEVGVVEHVRNGADCHPGTLCDILNARCTWPGVAVIVVTGPSSRLRHAGRLYPDSCLSEAVQLSHRAWQRQPRCWRNRSEERYGRRERPVRQPYAVENDEAFHRGDLDRHAMNVEC